MAVEGKDNEERVKKKEIRVKEGKENEIGRTKKIYEEGKMGKGS